MSALSQLDALQVEPVEDGTRVRFPCIDFDEQTTDGITEELYDLAIRHGMPSLYLDLDGVEYLASNTMGKLIVLDKKLRDAGGRLHLCNLCDRVYEVFHVSRLTSLLDVRPKDRAGAPGPGLIRV